MKKKQQQQQQQQQQKNNNNIYSEFNSPNITYHFI